jgi:hypothetical protein
MKVKQFDKKLGLHKETIANLKGDSMDKVKGGCAETDCRSCMSKPETCSIEFCMISEIKTFYC